MSYKDILTKLYPSEKTIPQNQPLPGQIPNNAGGYYYAIDDWARLDRFLILGTEAGTYYVSAIKLTKENAVVVQRLLSLDSKRVIDRIIEISTNGRTPKNDYALFALALAASAPDKTTRMLALQALPKVARIGTHVLMFTDFINHLRGWGRGLRKGISNWFLAMPAATLSLQAIKYSQRGGWQLRDLLRLAHPKAHDDERRVLIDWIAHPKKESAIAAARKAFRFIDGNYLVQEAPDAQAVAQIVNNYSLPREALPTHYLNSKEVWAALLTDMPITAMIRNLGKMSTIGLLEPMSEATQYVASRLLDREQLKKAKIHPIQLLLALRTYAQGHGTLGSLTWIPAPEIVEALNKAFELSFATIEPTGSRILVGIDVSGSMVGSRCAGSPILSCVEAASAVALLLVRTEKTIHTMAFDSASHAFTITPTQRLDDVINSATQWGGGTDLALPIIYALQKQLVVDTFVILTDGETWSGSMHGATALTTYRAQINPHAKIVLLSTAANSGSICDPEDPLAFGIAGFDAAAPQLVADFILGKI